MNKDQVKGRIEEAKGTVKNAAGKIVGDKLMEHEGTVEKVVGKVQAKYGDVKSEVKKAL